MAHDTETSDRNGTILAALLLVCVGAMIVLLAVLIAFVAFGGAGATACPDVNVECAQPIVDGEGPGPNPRGEVNGIVYVGGDAAAGIQVEVWPQGGGGAGTLGDDDTGGAGVYSIDFYGVTSESYEVRVASDAPVGNVLTDPYPATFTCDPAVDVCRPDDVTLKFDAAEEPPEGEEPTPVPPEGGEPGGENPTAEPQEEPAEGGNAGG
jgi:hypothetical protein